MLCRANIPNIKITTRTNRVKIGSRVRYVRTFAGWTKKAVSALGMAMMFDGWDP
jgi:hypothetical protein